VSLTADRPLNEDLPPDVSDRLLKLELRRAQLEVQELRQNNFLAFVKHVWPEFISGSHIRIMANKFEKVAEGTLRRVIINLGPRHSKSQLADVFLPAWMIGKNPKLKIIQATHTAELATDFGRQVKNLINTPEFKEVFPGVELAVDSKAAGKWNTNQGGSYFAVGVGGAIAGKGADIFICDDIHSEQDAMSPTALQYAYEWYQTGPRQRLQPGGRILVVQTRWAENDLTGNLLRAAAKNPKADQWEVIRFPAIMPSGKPCWPEYWPIEELLTTKESIGPLRWAAQYMQDPTSDETSILKRDWWRVWDKKDSSGEWVVPPLESIIQCYDTAYSAKETADYSAISTWGIFYPEEDGGPNIILLDAKRGRWDFPTLKRIAKEEVDFWEPEDVIVEAKASGVSLIQELRLAGIPVIPYTPVRGTNANPNNKMTRVNAIAPVLESGVVWAPGDSSGFAPWAEDLIHECAAFPKGEHDDMTDTAVLAWARYRKGGFVRVKTDEEDEPQERRRRYTYY